MLLASIASSAAFFNLPSLTPPNPVEVFKAAENALYAADRQRDELLSGVKRSLIGDPLDQLSPYAYALPPATSTIAVTGATDGLGREAAAFLANAGFAVIICARDVAKGERAAEYIRTSSFSEPRVSVVPLDLASVASVEEAAPLIVSAAAELGSPLRGLLLNAGIWPGQQQTTADGMELALQANHIGHWQLTQRLLPELETSGGEARVVTTSSSAHAFTSDAGIGDPLWESKASNGHDSKLSCSPACALLLPTCTRLHSPLLAPSATPFSHHPKIRQPRLPRCVQPFDTNANYGRAKLANLQFAQELAQRAPSNIRSLAVHPGLVLTTLFKELGPNYSAGEMGSVTGRSAVEDRLAGLPNLRELQSTTPLKVVLKSPEEGSRPLLYALLAPGLPNGAYLADCELRDTSPASKDVSNRQALWEWTQRWVESKVEASKPVEEAEVDCADEEECGLPSD